MRGYNGTLPRPCCWTMPGGCDLLLASESSGQRYLLRAGHDVLHGYGGILVCCHMLCSASSRMRAWAHRVPGLSPSRRIARSRSEGRSLIGTDSGTAMALAVRTASAIALAQAVPMPAGPLLFR
jgi:hypothetical protein